MNVIIKIIFQLHVHLNMINKYTVGIPMGTHCAPVIAALLFFLL